MEEEGRGKKPREEKRKEKKEKKGNQVLNVSRHEIKPNGKLAE